MKYFNYHAKAKKLITENHCINAILVNSYGKIEPALVLFFDNYKPMPIRIYHFESYFSLLEAHNVLIQNNIKNAKLD